MRRLGQPGEGEKTRHVTSRGQPAKAGSRGSHAKDRRQAKFGKKGKLKHTSAAHGCWNEHLDDTKPELQGLLKQDSEIKRDTAELERDAETSDTTSSGTGREQEGAEEKFNQDVGGLVQPDSASSPHSLGPGETAELHVNVSLNLSVQRSPAFSPVPAAGSEFLLMGQSSRFAVSPLWL